MKKILLFIVGLLAVSSMSAQVVYADFESDATTPYFIGFSQTTVETADNPDPTAGWDSPKVGKITKGTEVWDGFQVFMGGEFNYAGTDSTWSIWIYSDHAQTIRMGNQNYPVWQDACQVTAEYDTPNQWKLMTFKIPCGTDHYQTWTFTSDDGVNGPSVTYIDQLSSNISTQLVDPRTTRVVVKDVFDTKKDFTFQAFSTGAETTLVDDGTNGDEVAGDLIYSGLVDLTPYHYTDGLDITRLYDSIFLFADGESFSRLRLENAGTSEILNVGGDFFGLPDGGLATIRRFDNQPITIDGMISLEEAWNSDYAEKHFLVNAPWGAGVVLGFWQMYYDLANVYVLVTIQDPFLNYDPGFAVYDNDNQELYFNMDNAPAPDPAAYDLNDWQLRYIWSQEIWSGTHGQGEGFDWDAFGASIIRAQNTVIDRDGGTTMYEWQIPWTHMWGNFTPLPGVEFGFDVGYGDDPDGNGRTKIHSWNYPADEAYFNVDVFGKVTLGDPVGIHEKIDLDVNVYPNPASDKLVISVFDDVSEIQLMNTTGQLVSNTSEVHQGANTLHVSHLPSGVYVVKIINNKGNFDTRTIVVK